MDGGKRKRTKGKPINHRRSRTTTISGLQPDESVRIYWDAAAREWRTSVDAADPVIAHAKTGDSLTPDATT